MRENAPSSSVGFVYLKYVAHIAVMTGKIREAFPLSGRETLSDLLSQLDKAYPGLKEVFMPAGGVFNSRTSVIIRREGQPSFSSVDEKEKIRKGDTLTLW